MSAEREDGAPGGRDDGPAGGSGGKETDPGHDDERAHPRTHAADASLHSDALPDAVRCPHCGETDSEQFSAFGSAVSVSQFYCRGCRTVFETFKWR